MKIKFPSVTLQITILFVAVLAVSQIVALGYRYLARAEALPVLESVRIADRIAITAALVDRANAEDRRKLLELFDGSNLLLALTETPWLDGSSAADEQSHLLRELLVTALPGTTSTDVRVGYASSSTNPQILANLSRKWAHLRGYPAPLGQVVDEFVTDPTFVISVPLADGSWLNMIAAYADTLDFWPFDDMAVLGLMVIAAAVLSIWAIRHLTAPFRLFARAAARLGTDVNAPPIAEQGPAEVLSAIRAFNEMQHRLQRHIADRTLMVAAMSHDLRTPITRLRLRAEFIDNPTQRAKTLTDLRDMEQMIDGVLAFAKDDMLVEPNAHVDLASLLESISDDMADQGVCVSFDARQHPIVHCRPGSVRRCLVNLIDNAVKYGGRASVRLEMAASDVVVHVDDPGPGIPSDLREQVFRPFFRVESSRNRDSGGVGLGLGMARDVARAHGGDVTFGDCGGGGFRVSVRIPTGVPPGCVSLQVPDRVASGQTHAAG